MFISVPYLLAAASLASNVFGTAAKIQSAESKVAGAIYFITNDPVENKIISMNIAANGTLSQIKSTSTRGSGAHGIVNPIGPDPLFSQGAVQVNAAKNMLVTVNPGSNTLSMFSINPSQPAELSMVGSAIPSKGDFPISVAINPRGTMVCVLNGGAINGINCYNPNANLGLVERPNSFRSLGITQTTPATGPAGSASQIIFNADGTKISVSVKGIPPTPGFLATWDIAADGSLSSKPVISTPALGGLLPFSMTLIPSKNAILATDPGIGFSVYDFGKTGASMNATSTVVAIPGQVATCWSAYSVKSKNFYLSDGGTSVITEVMVDDNLMGSIVKQYPQAENSATLDSDVATIGKNSFLYVLAAGATSVNVLKVNKPGQATPVQNFNFTSAAKSANIEFDVNNLQGMATFTSVYW